VEQPTKFELVINLKTAARSAELSLLEMRERLIDDRSIALKPAWNQYRNRPVSFVMVWRKG
jgi:hypothetical protein